MKKLGLLVLAILTLSITQIHAQDVEKIIKESSKVVSKNATLPVGWAIRTSVFEDPQPQPQSLRFFEVED